MPKDNKEDQEEWFKLVDKSTREKLNDQELYRVQFLYQKHLFTDGFFDGLV